MFEEPDNAPAEDPMDPAVRAEEKADEIRMHAQLAAVFEGCRKFDATIDAAFDPDLARHIQQKIGRMEKNKIVPVLPVLAESAREDAAEVLGLPKSSGISTNDYHVYRRPGETMIIRW